MLLILIAGGIWAPGAGAAQVLDNAGGPTISALAGHVVWSRSDVQHVTWTLWSRTASGRVARVPVGSQPRPFDVDLGTDGRGRVVATFSRSGSPRQVTFDGAASRGRAEHALAVTAPRGWRVGWPARWRGKVVAVGVAADGRQRLLRGRVGGRLNVHAAEPARVGARFGHLDLAAGRAALRRFDPASATASIVIHDDNQIP